jgi:hypothetical protein
LRTGQDEFEVRRVARAEACVAPRATLIEKRPATEVYRVACEGGAERRYLCEFGRCAVR